jgi:hypothetical protein
MISSLREDKSPEFWAFLYKKCGIESMIVLLLKFIKIFYDLLNFRKCKNV